jgi:hypothetical protein
VIYDLRLELSRLMLTDFDANMNHILRNQS